MNNKKNVAFEMMCNIYFFLVTVLVPLYYESRYFNMCEAKWHIYVVGALILLGNRALASILSIPGSKKSNEDKTINEKIKSFKIDILDILIIAFGVNALISCLFSENSLSSFLGSDGWHIGGLTIALLVVWYLIFSRNAGMSANTKVYKNIWIIVIVVNAMIFFMSVLQSMGIDVLNMYYNALNAYYKYMGTFGNVNWIVAYMSVIFSVFFGFYLDCEEKASRIIYELFLFLCCLMMIMTESDGMYLAIGCLTLVVIPVAFVSEKRAFRMFHIIAMYGASLLLISILPVFAAKKATIDGICGLFLKPTVFSTIIAFGLLGMIIIRFLKPNKSILRIVGVAFEAVAGCIAAVIIFYSVKNFDPSWGTNRGRTWIGSFQLYKNYPIIRKIFGIGPELLRNSYKELSEFFGMPLLVSHSEPIQILLTMGAIGALIWLAFWVILIFRFIKNRQWRTNHYIYFLPLIAYLGQSFVNSAMTTNIVLMVLMLALYRRDMDVS